MLILFVFIGLCVVWLHVCMFAYVCAGICACMYALTISFFIHGGRVFQSSRVLACLLQGSSISAFPGWELQGRLCGCWRSELGSSCVHNECLTSWVVIPPPISCSFLYSWCVRTAARLHYSERHWQINWPLQHGQWRYQRKGCLERWRQHSFLCKNHQTEIASWCHPAARLPASDQKKVSSVVRVATWGLIFFF